MLLVYLPPSRKKKEKPLKLLSFPFSHSPPPGSLKVVGSKRFLSARLTKMLQKKGNGSYHSISDGRWGGGFQGFALSNHECSSRLKHRGMREIRMGGSRVCLSVAIEESKSPGTP